jgi:hypothetical protein
MRTIIVAVLIVFTIFAGAVAAGGYKITKVIEVGPGWGPVVGPLKWSPDGDKLAYFNKGALYVSDTLGNATEIASFGMAGYRYEWLNNEEVVVGLHSYRQGRISYDSIFIVGTSDRSLTTAAAYSGKPFSNPDAFIGLNDGPWLTVEGNVYYSTNIDPKKGALARGELVFPRGRYGQKGDTVIPTEDHIFSWGEDGLYLVRCDLKDSLKIAPRPYREIHWLPALSPDKSRYILGGTIFRFADSTYVVLDTMLGEKPKGTLGCGFLDNAFNPRFPEVIFNVSCDDGVSYDVSRVGFYNIQSNELSFVDPLIGINQCELPAYNPDGRRLALCSQGKVYIIYRESIGE